MIEETGVVVDVDGDGALVETRRQGACGGCSANGACGTSLLARYLGRRPLLLRAQNRAGAAPGDWVVVGVSEHGLMQASLAAYLVPVVGLIAGGVVAGLLFPAGGDGATAFLAFLGLALGLVWLRRFTRAHAADPCYWPVILRRVPGQGVTLSVPGGSGESADAKAGVRS